MNLSLFKFLLKLLKKASVGGFFIGRIPNTFLFVTVYQCELYVTPLLHKATNMVIFTN